MAGRSPIAVVGAGAVCVAGVGRRALVDALLEGRALFAASRQLAGSHPGQIAGEIPAAAEEADPTPPRWHERASRAARLAATAARDALADADWTGDREHTGFFLGVGASGGAISEIEALLRASVEAGKLSLAKMGSAGLAQCNPVGTFKTLHNFTLCTSAMLEGTGGPNAAFFSRGSGTYFALDEAGVAIGEGACTQALVGGADTALHPVTWAELVHAGRVGEGLVPGEGAAVLSLGSGRRPLAVLEAWTLDPARELIAGDADQVVIAGWGDPARLRLSALADARCPGAKRHDLTRTLGEGLAATPALAWVAAVELVARGVASRVAVLSEGLDGATGAATFGRPA